MEATYCLYIKSRRADEIIKKLAEEIKNTTTRYMVKDETELCDYIVYKFKDKYEAKNEDKQVVPLFLDSSIMLHNNIIEMCSLVIVKGTIINDFEALLSKYKKQYHKFKIIDKYTDFNIAQPELFNDFVTYVDSKKSQIKTLYFD